MKRLLLTILLLGALPTLLHPQLNNAVFNRSDCGLNYAYNSIRVTGRHPDHPGNPMPVTLGINGIPNSCYTIEAAYVWWIVSYYAGSPLPPTLTITNPQGNTFQVNAILAGQDIIKNWGELGTRCFRADVSNAITGNGNYTLSVNNTQQETDGLTLFIIYKDKLATYQGHFVIYDGLRTMCTGTNSLTQTLGGFTACADAAFARAFSIVSDMQKFPDPWRFVVDGVSHNQSRDFWNTANESLNITQNKNSVVFQIQPVDGDCYSWGMMGIYYQTTACITCPTGQINVNAGPKNLSVCPGNAATITASGAATYSWTSNPAGFTSNNASITVNPLVTTTYTVTGTSADGCFTDQDNVTVTVYPTPTANAGPDVGVCLGSSVQIGGLATGGSGNYTYSWTPSTGLSATDVAMPTASPLITTTYTVTVTDGNGCTGQDNVTVTVYPLPVLNSGTDRAICFGARTMLGNTSSGGTPPYSFSWTPPAGLDNPNTEFPQATPTATTTYICTMTDANGCVDIDTVVVTVNPLPQPVITALGPTTFCSCDSVTLDAGNLGYTAYLWSTNQTTRTIVVRNPGQYTVTVTDTNGCVNTSPPITINVIYPTAEISLPQNEVRAEPGEYINIPLYISNSQYLDTCKVRNFHAVISYNKTLLVPTGTTPQGTMPPSGQPDRTLDFTGTRGASDTLILMTFRATLGNAVRTPLSLNLFEWTDCPFTIQTISSEFILNNLCWKRFGGQDSVVRLYNYEGVPTGIVVTPNPVEEKATIEFSLAETGPTQLFISNVIGQVVRKFIDEPYEKGAYNLTFETFEIPSGLYYITLKTQTKVITKIMEVRK